MVRIALHPGVGGGVGGGGGGGRGYDRDSSSSGLASSSLFQLRALVTKVPLSVFAMIACAFAMGTHLGYERGVAEIERDASFSSSPAAVDASAAAATAAVAAPVSRSRRRSLSTVELLGRFHNARSNVRRTVRSEYGHYSGVVFTDRALLRNVFRSTDESRGRLRRRILRKVAEVQVLAEEREEEERQWPKRGGRGASGASGTPRSDGGTVRFVWATAGDSAASGIGNGPHRGYTSVLHDTVRDAFASIGVEFVARDRSFYTAASEGGGAEAELSLCMEDAYGSDVDVLTYDFGDEGGMGGGGQGGGGGGGPAAETALPRRRASLWSHRAASVHPSRPALLSLSMSSAPISSSASGNVPSIWSTSVAPMDGKGSSVTLMDDAALDGLLTPRLADDADPTRNHDGLPPPLRKFVCGGRREGSFGGGRTTGGAGDQCDGFADPTERRMCLGKAELDAKNAALPCLAEKFSAVPPGCEDAARAHQTSYNRGWKEHLLRGRLLGSFLLEVVQEALLELDELRHPPPSKHRPSSEVVSYRSILDQLRSKEEVDAFLFESSPAGYEAWDADGDALAEIAPEVLFRRRGVCHSGFALLEYSDDHGRENDRRQLHAEVQVNAEGGELVVAPAVVAAAGAIGNDAVGAEGGGFGAAKAVAADGAPVGVAADDGSNDVELQWTFDPADAPPCQEEGDGTLARRRRGFYEIREGEGWRSTTVPLPPPPESSSDSNIDIDAKMVVVCFMSFSTREENLSSLKGLDSIKLSHGNVLMEVNGVRVVGSKEVDGCHWLENESNGIRWDATSASGPSEGENGAGEEGEGGGGGGGGGGGVLRLRFRVDEPGAYIRVSSVVVL